MLWALSNYAANQVYVTELQNALEMADTLDKGIDTKLVEIEKQREISTKSIIELEDEDLTQIIHEYKGKHKLYTFSKLRSDKDFFKGTYFGKKDNMLSFQRKLMNKSLCDYRRDKTFQMNKNIDGEIYYKQISKLPLDIFKDILIFQKVKSDGNKIDAAMQILEFGKNNHILRDEIYSQISLSCTLAIL